MPYGAGDIPMTEDCRWHRLALGAVYLVAFAALMVGQALQYRAAKDNLLLTSAIRDEMTMRHEEHARIEAIEAHIDSMLDESTVTLRRRAARP